VKLTQEQKRIKLAEFAGLNIKPKTVCPSCRGNTPFEAGDDYGITIWAECKHCNNTGKVYPYIPNIPDYFNDLNAVHEREKSLLPDDAQYSQRNFYASELGRLTGNDNGQGWKPLSNDACFNILHATAAQRAEALGLTLNLWTE